MKKENIAIKDFREYTVALVMDYGAAYDRKEEYMQFGVFVDGEYTGLSFDDEYDAQTIGIEMYKAAFEKDNATEQDLKDNEEFMKLEQKVIDDYKERHELDHSTNVIHIRF